jgi:NAD(P)-dependent dehydrogenase (short-subunit alcohol dehydrogenase family)
VLRVHFHLTVHGLMAASLPQTAVVTGAASGLGLAIVERLAATGWQIAAVDLSFDGRPLPATAQAIPGDVRDAAFWRSLHERLRSQWATLGLVVNAAGVGATGEVGTLPVDQWRRVLDTNLLGTAIGCETFVPWLREGPRSHVVNVASIAATLAPPSMAAYAASKAGVVALSEAIAAECSPRRPGVTVVCPGFFRSGLLASWHFTSDVVRREAERHMNAARWSSERVAERVLTAVSRNRRYVVVGTRARWLWRLKRLAPRATTALINRVYRRLK